MWVSQLDLTQWRNHELTRLECSPGVTVLVGPNGHGKTNVVEGLRYLATLSSHRVASNTPLIRDGQDSATVFAQLHHGDREVSVGITVKRQGANEATLNGQKTKLTEIPRWVSTVMFAPEDSAIVRGEPIFRRAFMDELVLGGSPSMVALFSDADRLVKQRNSLLKSLRSSTRSADLSTLDAWTESFVAVAAAIISDRVRYLQEISPLVGYEYENLAGGDQVDILYSPKGYSFEDSRKESLIDVLRQAFESVRAEELERGMTLIGPHRDDMELVIDGKPARTHASQGETWSLALALRLGMAAWLREARASGDPILILDDVFAELDVRRREKLVGAVTGYEQLVITSAVETDLPSGLEGVRIDVHKGVVSTR